ncbi:phytoene/squalene synthetase [Sediminihabitans luteus]|uniref:Phytoene/squalene synthetase n=1 Tax=Sediminihabitans luteus TaxID=1138585 RepID=A0A2M9D0B9_9CELL|nr:squalene/phytoene synthase family protein [Sediminihabitans luteus]PJJ77597.1 phytoene/squalene synthetase [Sediminihabitans luteus]GII98497.1 phytoene synthase [Sediminihabitans luteus]
MSRAVGAALYDRAAYRASHGVLAEYSTSFGLGARLLGRRARAHIDAVYGLVRVADEIVDTRLGPDAAQALDALEAEARAALVSGWSANLVVHAFARTAAEVGIDRSTLDPFFASMRADLTVLVHDKASYERYVYGSAEVVGLMCLAVFLAVERPEGAPVVTPDAELVRGARALGAAFQKINFLRDLRADYADLGRCYFPGVTPETLDDACLAVLLAEIRDDVEVARTSMPGLPRRARAAVAATLALYDRLLVRLAATPPTELLTRRVRVPDAEKALVAGRAAVRELVRVHA